MTLLHRGLARAGAVLLAAAAAAAFAAEPPPGSTGPSALPAVVAEPLQFVRRARDEVGPLPYDARYGDLSPAERDLVRSAYDAMPADDEPPYPAQGMGALMRPLVHAAHEMYIDGTIDALVEVGPDGAPRSVAVYRSPEPIFTKVVASVLMGASYKPALCKGVPCTMQFPLRVTLPPS
jgi:hypothetical protein